MSRGRTALLLLVALGASLVLTQALVAKDGPSLDADNVRGARPLLAHGELVLVRSTPAGSPEDATAMAVIAAPIEVVWKTVRDYPSYPTFVPRVVSADIVDRKPKHFDVAYEVEVPGRNPSTTIRFTFDEAKRTIDGRWIAGDIKGGRWAWALYPGEKPGTTIATYTTHADGGSGATGRLVRSLDDKYHTMAFAIDASTALLMVRAVKDEAERRAPTKTKTGKRQF